MNIIKPTPSQAAVALKKFFARHNIDIKLSLAQEAIAVTSGYPNWNVLAADVPTREVKAVPSEGSEQLGEEGLQMWALSGRVDGADDDSLYMCWAHDEDEAKLLAKMWLYDVTDPTGLPTEEEDIPIYINCSTLVGTIEGGKFCLSESLKPAALRRDTSAALSQPEPYMAPSPVEGATYDPTLQELIDMNGTLLANGVVDEDDRLEAIQNAMYKAALTSGLFEDWTYQDGRGERAIEGDDPFIQVSFDRSMGRKFATEIVLTLRGAKMAAYVRTWQFFDDIEPSRNYAIFDEAGGDFDTDAILPELDAPLSELVQNALAEAQEHKARLREELDLN